MKAKDFLVSKKIECTNIKAANYAFDGKDLLDAFNVSEEDQLEILKLIHGEDIDESGFPLYSNIGATEEMEIISANLGIKLILFDDYNDRYLFYL